MKPSGNTTDSQCKLCLNNRPLSQSHIIPEFIYELMYDRRHRVLEVADVNAGKISLHQKGIREPLLCGTCESRLNRYERYSRRLFVDPWPPPEKPGSRWMQFPNLDYQPLKLFLLSVLWRASISSQPMFKHVDLGPHEERIRQLLINDTAVPPSMYPCIVLPLLLDGNRCDILVEPFPVRSQGHKGYTFVFGGLVVLFCVSSHRLPDSLEKFILDTRKPIRLHLTHLHELRFLRDLWNRVIESTKDAETSFGT